MWRETRVGVVVHERVCDEHLAAAVGARYGYRTDTPPIPPPAVAPTEVGAAWAGWPVRPG